MTEQLTRPITENPTAVEDSSAQGHDTFASMYAQYYPQVLGMLLNRGAGGAAEDIAQESFTRAFAKLDAQTKEGSFYGWVMRIAANAHIDYLRRKDQSAVVCTDDADALDRQIPLSREARPSDTHVLEMYDLEETMAKLLDILSEDEAKALALTVRGYTTDQISAELNANPSTIKSRVRRGRNALKAAGIRPTSI